VCSCSRSALRGRCDQGLRSRGRILDLPGHVLLTIRVGIVAAWTRVTGKVGGLRKVVTYMLVSVDGVAEDPDQFLFELGAALVKGRHGW
jgi:hypothetical protein